MKKLIFASGILALMAAATSCEKYDIYPEQFDSVFTIRDAGTIELPLFATDAVAEYPITILKGGYDPEVTSTATLKVLNDEEFADYNAELGGLPYILVDKECYSFSPNLDENVYARTFEFFTADHKSEQTSLYLRPGVIKTWLETNADAIGKNTPVVPIMLVSETDTVNAYGNVIMLKVDVRTPEFTVDIPEVVSRTVNKQTFSTEEANNYTPQANFSIPCENPWGFTLKFIGDPEEIRDIVENYNDETGSFYIPMKANQFTLVDSIRFEPGVTSMPLDLTIHLDSIPVGKRQYAVAVAFDDPGIVWDDENFNPGSGLKFNKDRVMIFTVRVNNNTVLEKVNLSTANVIASDPQAGDGSLAELFDGSINTYYHSNWSSAAGHSATYGSYLEITLPNEMSAFRFNMSARHNNGNGIPYKVCLFGTNDTNSWPTTPFATIENMQSQMTAAGASGSYGTDEEPFGDGKSYKYIRFCVMQSAGGDLTSTSGGFWAASELELYGN